MYRFLIAIMLAFISNTTNAQLDSIAVHPHNYHGVSDTTRLNPKFNMVVEFPRPPIYDIWFKNIVACEGLPMPPQEEIDKIQFFIVNAESFGIDSSTNEYYDGITKAKEHIIIIDLPNVWKYDVVAHEFLHFALWYQFGDKYVYPPNTHPNKYFGQCNIRNQ